LPIFIITQAEFLSLFFTTYFVYITIIFATHFISFYLIFTVLLYDMKSNVLHLYVSFHYDNKIADLNITMAAIFIIMIIQWEIVWSFFYAYCFFLLILLHFLTLNKLFLAIAYYYTLLFIFQLIIYYPQFDPVEIIKILVTSAFLSGKNEF
jgi:hypothetical protein